VRLSVVAAAGIKRSLSQYGSWHEPRLLGAPLQLAPDDNAHAVAHVQGFTFRQLTHLHQAEQDVQLVGRQRAEERAAGDGRSKHAHLRP
jgi:hypothetical protein